MRYYLLPALAAGLVALAANAAFHQLWLAAALWLTLAGSLLLHLADWHRLMQLSDDVGELRYGSAWRRRTTRHLDSLVLDPLDEMISVKPCTCDYCKESRDDHR